jgi:hypothetical protein
LVLTFAFAAWACEKNITLGNAKVPGSFFYGASDASRVGGQFWVPGSGSAQDGLGKDSGRYLAASAKANLDWTNTGTEAGRPYLVIAGSWAANKANPSDDCPDIMADPVTVALWEQTGEGTPAHAGKFVCATTKFSRATSRYNFSAPMTPANDKQFQPIPTPKATVKGSAVEVSWNLPSAGVSQYYDATLQAPAVITGWEVFYAKGPAPTTGDAGAWTLKATVAGGATTASLNFRPDEWNPAAGALHIAIRPIFDKTFRTPFVGAHASVGAGEKPARKAT